MFLRKKFIVPKMHIFQYSNPLRINDLSVQLKKLKGKKELKKVEQNKYN